MSSLNELLNQPVSDTAAAVAARAPTEPRKISRPATKPLVWSLPGFGPMARITTSFGEVHAQTLRERDLVRTRSGEFKPIKWIDRIVLEEEFLKRHSDAQPILIRVGALGRGLPRQDILLSPRQTLAPLAGQFPGSAKVASDLLHKAGVFRKAESTITYTMFHCGTPEVVMCEKLWVAVSP